MPVRLSRDAHAPGVNFSLRRREPSTIHPCILKVKNDVHKEFEKSVAFQNRQQLVDDFLSLNLSYF